MIILGLYLFDVYFYISFRCECILSLDVWCFVLDIAKYLLYVSNKMGTGLPLYFFKK